MKSYVLVSDLKQAIYDSWLRDQITHVRTVLPVGVVVEVLKTLDIGDYHATSGGGMDEHESAFVEAWSVDDNRDWRIRVSIESQVDIY
jgi:hypothetical protein